MEYFLFFIYLLLFCWIITRTRFFINSGLSRKLLISLFLLKVAAGLFYGFMDLRMMSEIRGSDSWQFHTISLEEYEKLKSTPALFLTDTFTGEKAYSSFTGPRTFWHYIKHHLLSKILAIINLFTGGNYFINVIFINYFSFWGLLFFYRSLIRIFPGKVFPILTALIIPSFFLWNSAILKEGFIFTAFALFVYALLQIEQTKKLSLKQTGFILTGVLLIIGFRYQIFPFVALAVLLSIITSFYFPRLPVRTYLIGYGLCATVFLCSYMLYPPLNFISQLVKMQQFFLTEQGNSTVSVTPLTPDILSVIKLLPQTLPLLFIRPFPNEISNVFVLLAMVENYLLIGLILLLFLFPEKNKQVNKNLLCFMFFLSAGVLLMIGYINVNLGTIMRYKSIFLPLLYAPLLASINWQKIKSLFTQKSDIPA